MSKVLTYILKANEKGLSISLNIEEVLTLYIEGDIYHFATIEELEDYLKGDLYDTIEDAINDLPNC